MLAMVVECIVTESALLMRMREDGMETLLMPDGASVSEVSVSEPPATLKNGREREMSVKEMEVKVALGVESGVDLIRKCAVAGSCSVVLVLPCVTSLTDLMTESNVPSFVW